MKNSPPYRVKQSRHSSREGASTVSAVESPSDAPADGHILSLSEVNLRHTRHVGGKAASLGEMIRELGSKGIRVPQGFVITARAYQDFLRAPVPPGTWKGLDELRRNGDGTEARRNGDGTEARRNGGGDSPVDQRVQGASTLHDALRRALAGIDPANGEDVRARASLARKLCLLTPVPGPVQDALTDGYFTLCSLVGEEIEVAVRSSATEEDSAEASFAGQFDSFLNVRGAGDVTEAWRRCVASRFTERAVTYQLDRGLPPLAGSVAVIVMRMVRSDLAASGIVFTLDPDSGNPSVLHLTSSYGLGELVVQGGVNPDTFLVWKEGVRRERPAIVHRRRGDKEHMLVYEDDPGNARSTLRKVKVPSELRGRWSLEDSEVLELARMAIRIEEHYGQPMDIEWAKDGRTGEIFITQARPETVHGRESEAATFTTYSMDPSLLSRLEEEGRVLLTGEAVGQKIAAGTVRIHRSYDEVVQAQAELRKLLDSGVSPGEVPPEKRVFEPGDVLVTELTTPDWEPLMKEASLIVTERGGRTSHAAIVAREFGVPAVVGCRNATSVLRNLQEVTGTCAQGDTGMILDGIHPFRTEEVDPVQSGTPLRTRIKLNVGFPDRALADARLPSDGVGLARLEFILTSTVGIHPLALAHHEELGRVNDLDSLPEALHPFRERIRTSSPAQIGEIAATISRRITSYADGREFFVDQLLSGIATICAAFHPRPVMVRLSDLKSNEYRDLLGGSLFEPVEENPMLALRGAARYVDPRFRPAFEMECEALRLARHGIGLDNLEILIPFCRSPEEGRRVVELLDGWGLSPGDGVPLHLMVEVPSNVLDADAFIDEMKLAGGSIGTNDLVQTVYAVSRDDLEGYAFPVDARSAAVKEMVRRAVETFRGRDLEIGICGQAPSDHPDEVVPFLVECGIGAISVTADTLLQVRRAVGRTEERLDP